MLLLCILILILCTLKIFVMHFNFNFMHIKNYCYARMRNRIRNGIISSFFSLEDKLVVYGVRKKITYMDNFESKQHNTCKATRNMKQISKY